MEWRSGCFFCLLYRHSALFSFDFKLLRSTFFLFCFATGGGYTTVQASSEYIPCSQHTLYPYHTRLVVAVIAVAVVSHGCVGSGGSEGGGGSE